MAGLIFSQWLMWMIMILGISGVWAVVYWKKKEPTFAFAISGALAFLVVIVFSLGIRYGTGVSDICVLNGHVQSATYEEEWTEEYWVTVETRDSKGNVTSSRQERRERTHSPSWDADTTLGGHGISEERFNTYKRIFRNLTQTGSGHGSQCSSGDGRTFQTTWRGEKDTLVPWAETTDVVNWLKASYGSVYRTSGEDLAKVPNYPELEETQLGPRQPRVHPINITLPPDWKSRMEHEMDVLADGVGHSKQCNPLLFVVNGDITFTQSLKDKWLNGKKNDVIIVIGTKSWPTVDWVQVVSWTKNDSLEPFIKLTLLDVPLTDEQGLMKTLWMGITQHFERRPMAEFEYLKREIHIPTWIYVLSLLLASGAILGSFFLEESVTSQWPKQVRQTYRNSNNWPPQFGH